MDISWRLPVDVDCVCLYLCMSPLSSSAFPEELWPSG